MGHSLDEALEIVGKVDAVSEGAGATSTGWVDAAGISAFLAIVGAGTLGASATLDGKFEQATSAAGAGVKDITKRNVASGTVIAIPQLVDATDDNETHAIGMTPQLDMDIQSGFTHVRFTVTVATAACLVAVALLADRDSKPVANKFLA